MWFYLCWRYLVSDAPVEAMTNIIGCQFVQEFEKSFYKFFRFQETKKVIFTKREKSRRKGRIVSFSILYGFCALSARYYLPIVMQSTAEEISAKGNGTNTLGIDFFTALPGKN
jgi:hypothetical protein